MFMFVMFIIVVVGKYFGLLFVFIVVFVLWLVIVVLVISVTTFLGYSEMVSVIVVGVVFIGFIGSFLCILIFNKVGVKDLIIRGFVMVVLVYGLGIVAFVGSESNALSYCVFVYAFSGIIFSVFVVVFFI